MSARTRTILWRHHDETLHVTNISIDGVILREFANRFSILSNEDTNQLVINDVRQSDTGRYECITDNGIGESHSVILFVSGKEST